MKKIQINDDIFIKTPAIEDALQSYQLLDKDRDELMDIFNFVEKDSTLSDEEDFIRELDSDKYFFNIFFKNNICGKIGIFAYDEKENSYEIYYYIGSEYRGYGIATMTIKGFAHYVFGELKAEKLKFFINIDNDNSNKMAERLGLKYIETVKERDYCNGIYHDQHLYEMYSTL